MAEYVGIQQETSLPIYEKMKSRNLASDAEVREIVKTRNNYEYKLNKATKELKDFGEYIAYERKLLSIIHNREKQQNPNSETLTSTSKQANKKFGPVEASIVNNIKSIFRRALQLFPDEPKLWECYVKFCKNCNFLVDASNAFEMMLQYHGHKPITWLTAIKHEYKDMENMEKVKDLLLRAVQHHPENKEIHIEFMKFLLSEIEKLDSNNSDEIRDAEKEAGLNRVEVLYKSSRQRICQLQYLTDVLKLLEDYSFTRKLQKIVIQDMINAFPRNELTWHILAMRELKGLHTSEIMDDNNDAELITTKVLGAMDGKFYCEDIVEYMDVEEENAMRLKAEGLLKKTLRKRIDLCCCVYQNAVKTLKTEKMWSLYINTMTELNHDKSTQRVIKEQKLSEAYNGAIEAGLMSEKHYESYINLLKDSKENITKLEMIMKRATQDHPHAVLLWELWMEHYVTLNDMDKVNEIFRKANKKLASESFPLWDLLLRYYQTRDDLKEKVEETFKEAVQYTSPNFLKFRCQFLQWVLLNFSIKKARIVYDEMTYLYPPYYELHTTMELFESSQIRPCLFRWRKCHENIVRAFGKERTDVWINYLKFERDHTQDAKNLSPLFERAKASLRGDLVNQFLSEHTYFMTGLIN